MKYESPKFTFEELGLSERIADVCWGYAYAWYNGQRVDLSDLGLGSNGCQGKNASDALSKYFGESFNPSISSTTAEGWRKGNS